MILPVPEPNLNQTNIIVPESNLNQTNINVPESNQTEIIVNLRLCVLDFIFILNS